MGVVLHDGAEYFHVKAPKGEEDIGRMTLSDELCKVQQKEAYNKGINTLTLRYKSK